MVILQILMSFDLINVDGAASESTYAKFVWEMDEEIMYHQGKPLM